MQSLYAQVDGTVRRDLTRDEITAALQDAQGLLWVDLDGAEPNAHEALLAETFNFHPLAIDDTLNEVHLPKLDDWETYLYLVLREATYDRANNALKLSELDVFLGDNYIITYHVGVMEAIERVWTTVQRNVRWLQHGPDHILYRVIDELVNQFTAAIDTIEDDLEVIEAEIFQDPAPDTLEVLFDLKRTIQQLRRVLAPQRDVVNKLARDEFAVVGPKDRLYFRDVHDHMLRLYDLSDNLRDLAMVALDTYLSVVNNRMNDIMKTLTLITTLFMPLTFLTGFFGMNFFSAVLPLEAWTGRTAFTLTLAAMAAVPVIMYLWMRRRAWM